MIEMHMQPYLKHPHHAILNLEGGPDEVLHLRALGKDLKIEMRIDEAKTGIVITTRDGMFRQAISGSRNRPKDADHRERVKRA